jgi:hypothetical protein
MSSLSATPVAPAVDRSKILKAGAIAVLGSVAANVVLLLILTPLLGLSPAFMPFGIGPIAFFTAFYTLLATVLFWLLARFTRQPVRIFLILAAIGFVVTAVPNVALAANPVGAPFPGTSADFLTLLIFHLAPFAITVWALTTLTRAAR